MSVPVEFVPLEFVPLEPAPVGEGRNARISRVWRGVRAYLGEESTAALVAHLRGE